VSNLIPKLNIITVLKENVNCFGIPYALSDAISTTQRVNNKYLLYGTNASKLVCAHGCVD